MEDYLSKLQAKRTALQKKVRQGRAVKALEENAPDIFELIDTEISIALNKLTQPEPLGDREYLAQHGYIKGLQKARDIMNSTKALEVSAAEEVKSVDGQIKAATS